MAYSYDKSEPTPPVRRYRNKSADTVLNPPTPTPTPGQAQPDGTITLPSGRRAKLRDPATFTVGERNELANTVRPGIDDASAGRKAWSVVGAQLPDGVDRPEQLPADDYDALVSAVVGAVTAFLEQIPGGAKLAEANALEAKAATYARVDPQFERECLVKAAQLRREADDVMEIMQEVATLNKSAALTRRTENTVAAMRQTKAIELRAMADQPHNSWRARELLTEAWRLENGKD